MTEPVNTFIVTGWSTGCAPFGGGVATPAPPGIYAAQINYLLGNIGPGKKKVVRVQLRQQ